MRSAYPSADRISLVHGAHVKRRLLSFASSSLLLCVFGLFGHPAETQGVPKQVEVTATRFAFTPAEITLKRGQPVVLVLNSPDVAHGLRFRELNQDAKIPAKGSAEMRFTPDKIGDFVGHCSVFCGSGHGAMALMLHVVE
jgi:cytochrome c oxidase subunit II